jgi:hypothetical protein
VAIGERVLVAYEANDPKNAAIVSPVVRNQTIKLWLFGFAFSCALLFVSFKLPDPGE